VFDSWLRELERRWQRSGALLDEVALLRGRVRAGELSPERLELAAFCGHAGAGAACSSASQVPERDPQEALAALARWGKPAVVCVCVLAARTVLPLWMSQGGLSYPQRCLMAAEDWLASPSDSLVAEAGRVAVEGDRSVRCSASPVTPAYAAASCVSAAQCAAECDIAACVDWASSCVVSAASARAGHYRYDSELLIATVFPGVAAWALRCT